MKKSLLILFLFSIFSVTAFGQKKFEGTVHYNISYEDMAEQIKSQEEMLPKEMSVSISGDMSETVQPSSVGKTTVITNNKTMNSLVLMDIMGQKIAVKADKTDMEEEDKKSEDGEIKYLDEKKEIMGYNCKKATSTVKGGNITIFYTNELPSISVSRHAKGIKGFPLEMIIETDLFTNVIVANNIKKEKLDITLDVPEGYELKTKEEINKMFSGGK